MLPLLIKDHLVTAFVASVIIYYLVADLCLLAVSSKRSANVHDSGLCSQTSALHFHVTKSLSLMVCNPVPVANRCEP